MAQNSCANVARELDKPGCPDHWSGGIGEYRFMTDSRAVHAQSRAEQIGQDERKTMVAR